MFNADLAPDWTLNLTPDAAEREFDGFHWNGPGLYKRGEDTMLVVPVNRSLEQLWDYVAGSNERFRFSQYTGRNIADVINALAHVPTRRG